MSAWMPTQRRQGHVDLRQLLGEHRVEAVVAGLGAAELLGDLEAEEALLAGGQPELARQPVALGVLVQVRDDLAVQELLDGGAERLVVLVVDLTAHEADVTRESPRCRGIACRCDQEYADPRCRPAAGRTGGRLRGERPVARNR